jgi:hypothetical protein
MTKQFNQSNTRGYTDAELARANQLIAAWDRENPAPETWPDDECHKGGRDRACERILRGIGAGVEGVRVFPWCESCGSSATGGHCLDSGSSTLDLCDGCAARLCACGSLVLSIGAAAGLPGSVGNGNASHGFHRCEAIDADGNMRWYHDRAPGCACSACAGAAS